MMLTRRSFLAASATAATSSLIAQTHADESTLTKNPVCFFSKPFNSLSFDQLARKTAELGFDGIEAPIRSGGHIPPEAVPDQLPQLTTALAKHNVKITVMTSDINDPAAPMTEKVLRTAAGLGIRYYRMKYFKYDESKSITAQIENWKSQLADLAGMNKDLGITAVYQNHAGRNYFGAPIWDMHRALEGIDPNHVGVAYDIRHATVEAGMSWPVSFQLIRPHIKVVYVKDFAWGDARPSNVPLGDGRVDAKFFGMLAKTNFTGPISLHEEYLDHRNPELVPAHWDAIEKDFGTLKSWL